ncbi:protein PNS1 [Colletotrichum plurivorum]|uniref:Protein PNS1 n=1 Tax=Colletotrichum plurivorum TaxID=2175906 RepID=A0A8H6JCD8_9PEZI|nr:protein PNS1 [Colletotrichum plurivorum]
MSQPYGQAAGYYGQQQQQPYDPKYAQQHQQYNNGYQPGYQQAQGYPPPQQFDGSNNYGYNPPPQGHDPEKYTFEEAFKIEKPKWNDLWAAILFLACFLGFAAVSGLTISGYSSTKGLNGGGIYDGGNTFGLSTHTIVLFAFCLAVAVVLSYAYVWMARLFPKAFIWVTGILNIVFAFVTAIYMLSRRYYSGGIVFLIFAIFLVIAFISWIPRIPFSALMLKTSIRVSKNYGHVYLVSFLGGMVGAAFAAWYSVTLVATYSKFQPSPNNPQCRNGGCSQGKVIGIIVFITFAMYWISEVLKNIIHVTISGVYGSWYFCVNNFPKGATRGALKRSLTYSFGSISFGSLIVAIINFLRHLCSVAKSQSAADGNIVGYVLFCILGCLISLLDWAVSFFNRFAFSHIALYGKAYIPAAKDTWSMIKDRGFDALINDCLIGPVLSFGATFVGYACALLAYLYMVFTNPAYNQNGAYTPVVVAFAFLIGLQIANIFTTPISSGIDTIFVAAAWDPQVLMRDHRQLYDEMVRVYPEVQQHIHA